MAAAAPYARCAAPADSALTALGALPWCERDGVVYTSTVALGALLGVNRRAVTNWTRGGLRGGFVDTGEFVRRALVRELPREAPEWEPFCRSSSVQLITHAAALRYLQSVYRPAAHPSTPAAAVAAAAAVGVSGAAGTAAATASEDDEDEDEDARDALMAPQRSVYLSATERREVRALGSALGHAFAASLRAAALQRPPEAAPSSPPQRPL